MSGEMPDIVVGHVETPTKQSQLDLMYAYVAFEGLADGAVDVRVGRQVELDQLDAWAYDGARVRIHAPGPVAVEVAGGVRVRDASPMGPSVYELDGTLIRLLRLVGPATHTAAAHELAITSAGATGYLAPGDDLDVAAGVTAYVATTAAPSD